MIINNQWTKLWDIALGGNAKIEVTDNEFEVALRYPDGSCAVLYWHENDWQFAETLNSCPGDVAARDSL